MCHVTQTANLKTQNRDGRHFKNALYLFHKASTLYQIWNAIIVCALLSALLVSGVFNGSFCSYKLSIN